MMNTTQNWKRSLELEQIMAMIDQELKTCNESRKIAETHLIWRRKICEWAYNVVDHFHLDREVVSLSLSYLDQYISIKRNEVEKTSKGMSSRRIDRILSDKIDGRTFQLAATTSLYIAIKVHGEHIDRQILDSTQKLTISSFVDLSRGQFSAEDLVSMELELLEALKWRVNPPTPVKFAAYLLRLLPTQLRRKGHREYNDDIRQQESKLSFTIDERVVHVLYELSRYLTEVSVYVHSLSATFKPSVVAYATVLISINLIDTVALPQENRELFLARVKRLTSLSPNSPEVKEVIAQVHEICPDITDCDSHLSASVSKDHPIIIAREAGFLASAPAVKKSFIIEDRSVHSPCSVTENEIRASKHH